MVAIGIYVKFFTFSTAGDIELGPLAEKSATLGDNHFPITVFGILSLAIGDLIKTDGKR